MSKYAQYSVPKPSTMLALGVGQPSPKYFEIMNHCPTDGEIKPLELFQYGLCSGSEMYRTAVANMLTKYTGKDVDPKSLYMTNGVSQAVFMLSALFKGKHVFVEDPTYFIMLKTFNDLGYQSHTLDLSNLSLFDEELTKLFTDDPDNYIVTYIVPFYQNPTGKTIRQETIGELCKLCDKYPKLKILSDETYQMVSFGGTYHISLSTYHKNILSLGTFSKILAPACRLGWIQSSSNDIIHFLDETGFMDSGGCVNPIIGYNVASLINTPFFDTHIDNLTDSLGEKANMLYRALTKYPDHFEVENVEGGYFLWVKSKLLSATKLLDIAKKHKVSFHVGSKFSHTKNFGDYFRLSFSYYSEEDLECFETRLKYIVDDVNRTFRTLKKNVYLLGCNGKLGSLIREDAKEQGYEVHEIPKGCDFSICEDAKNIVVDVSSATGTKTLIEKLLFNKIYIPLIVGTTGDLPMDLIDEYKKYTEVMIVPNFSVGVNMVDNMLKLVSPSYWSAAIYDLHHERKKDAPSGTAKRFMSSLEPLVDSEILITSERKDDHVGHHTITLTSKYETVTITHTAFDRRLFARGCVELIKKMIG